MLYIRIKPFSISRHSNQSVERTRGTSFGLLDKTEIDVPQIPRWKKVGLEDIVISTVIVYSVIDWDYEMFLSSSIRLMSAKD